MKKQLIILVFTFFLINSCNTDILDLSNGNAISINTFPANKAEVEIALNGTYSPLQAQGLYGRHIFYMNDFMAGDECKVIGGEARFLEFNTYTFDANNNLIEYYWRNAYNGISRCNLILDKETEINAFPEAELAQVDKDNIIGQAKFLRALYYFLLVERFGDIPLYTSSPQSTEGAGKSSKTDVYALIISDLQDASTKLKPKSTAEIGRATKGAAQALLGKVYLYQGNFASAKTEFAKVISSGEYSLTANYFDNFENVHENNLESIFEVRFEYNGGGWAYADWGGQDVGNTETSFRSISYDAVAAGWRNCDPSQNLIDEFEVGDSRKGDNFYFTGDTWAYGTVDVGANQTWRKYDVAFNSANWNGLSDINHRVIRYADVLLMMAEAENETGGQAAAVSYLNQVRNRVSMPNYGTAAINVMYPVTTQAEVFAAIRHERRVELAGEQSRFPDLLRWGMANTIPGFVIGKHELFPIPQKELDTNPNLSTADQNPGY